MIHQIERDLYLYFYFLNYCKIVSLSFYNVKLICLYIIYKFFNYSKLQARCKSSKTTKKTNLFKCKQVCIKY